MNDAVHYTRTLTFQWTPWSLAASVLLVSVAVGLSFVAWRRSGYRASMGLLELLRIVLVTLAAVLLNQPEIVQEFRPNEKPSIAVLWDASPSMDTRDVAASGSAKAAPVSRRQAVAAITDPAFWKKLEERFQVVVQSFSEPGGKGNTDLYSPLSTAPAKFKNLVGVVLVSDGDWNAGLPPVEAATLLRLKEVPVLAVPVGSPVRLPDVEVRSLDAPTFAILGKSVRIPFTIESSLPRDYVTNVVLLVQRRRSVQGGPHCRDGRYQRLAGVEAGGTWRHDADAGSPPAPRRNDNRQQQAERAGFRPQREAEGPARGVVSALGVPLSPQRLVARSGRRAVVHVVPPRYRQARRRQQRLHQAISRRPERAFPFRRGLSGRRGGRQRPAYRGTVRLVEGTGRAPGERHRFHAGERGDCRCRCRRPSWTRSIRSFWTRPNRTAGDRARPAISSSRTSGGGAC